VIIDSKSKDPFTGQLLPSQMFPATCHRSMSSRARQWQKVVRDLKLADAPGTRDSFMKPPKARLGRNSGWRTCVEETGCGAFA